jgi:competence protein ComEC
MLLGIEANIPDSLYDQFNATGTSHVIVISGTNVALLSGVIVAVAARMLGKRRALWPALGAIACYALLVGGDAAVVRASVMGGLFVTAAALNRRSTALVSLAAACMAMTLANPLALWDVGLQLSGAATAGLVLLAPVCARWLHWLLRQSPAWLRMAGEDVLAVTVAASLATLPLALYHFGRLSLVSLPANLLIAPLQPLILFGGSAALLVGLAGQELLGGMLLWLPWLGLAWTVAVVRWTACLPFAAVNVGSFGLPQLVVAYAVIGMARWQRELWDGTCGVVGAIGRLIRGGGCRVCTRLLVSPVTLVAAAVLAALVWVAALAQPDGRLHVWFLDVGQGDGIFIQTPSGRQVLIDGGSSAQALLGQLGAVMPFWDRTLDLVILTHPDADHMAAQVEAAGRFAIDAAWETPASATDANSAAWRMAVTATGADLQIQNAGGWADLGDSVALWVLGPPAQPFGGEDADNGNSLIAKLVYGVFSVLLTGDAGAAAEARLLQDAAPLQATVLKVAHHGSKFSSADAFVAVTNASLAVIQVGENRYGHPDSAVLERLATRTVLRTDVNGRIEVASDGRQVWVEKEQE